MPLVALSRTNSVDVALNLGDTIGPTPTGCIELLQVRPLLVGTAWKVLDLLLETALDLVPLRRDRNHHWSIDAKVKHARANTGRPPAIPLWPGKR